MKTDSALQHDVAPKPEWLPASAAERAARSARGITAVEDHIVVT